MWSVSLGLWYSVVAFQWRNGWKVILSRCGFVCNSFSLLYEDVSLSSVCRCGLGRCCKKTQVLTLLVNNV